MVRYIIKRVIMALITLFIITFLLFLLVRIMPGNPFPSERMSDEAIEKKREEMGLNDPFLGRYLRYVRDLFLKGDLGTSYKSGLPVMKEITRITGWSTAQASTIRSSSETDANRQML